jgi:hypothetical protein
MKVPQVPRQPVIKSSVARNAASVPSRKAPAEHASQSPFHFANVPVHAPDPGPPANDTGLPDRLKSGIESLSGLSLDNVRVHYRSPRPARIDALAYTQGAEIHLAPGQERHLPHEA